MACLTQVVGFVVKKHPIVTLTIPILVLFVFTGLGVYGTLAGAQNAVNNNKDTAYSAAVDTSVSFKLSLQVVSDGCMATLLACGSGWTLITFVDRRPLHL